MTRWIKFIDDCIIEVVTTVPSLTRVPFTAFEALLILPSLQHRTSITASLQIHDAQTNDTHTCLLPYVVDRSMFLAVRFAWWWMMLIVEMGIIVFQRCCQHPPPIFRPCVVWSLFDCRSCTLIRFECDQHTRKMWLVLKNELHGSRGIRELKTNPCVGFPSVLQPSQRHMRDGQMPWCKWRSSVMFGPW